MFRFNHYTRYQKGMTLQDVFPLREDGLCACGCNKPLTGRQKRWSSKKCQEKALTHFLIIKGDNKTIRRELLKRDNGVCSCCGISNQWHADHILPVFRGGGFCDIDNLQTLCLDCHTIKHQKLGHWVTISTQAASISANRLM